ncbi:hypothetical protein QBC40DRAFT_172316 [Triangularia verruculosa]|uniref:Uncharacterized protein n=1 Tax=Triangularia verruculosa TaxID=2587418 RepID=A0AAN7AVZ8_9PEZI|nr:hypothetical protein QBC40DRAFT_172316 [Triangularia verruculosa]
MPSQRSTTNRTAVQEAGQDPDNPPTYRPPGNFGRTSTGTQLQVHRFNVPAGADQAGGRARRNAPRRPSARARHYHARQDNQPLSRSIHGDRKANVSTNRRPTDQPVAPDLQLHDRAPPRRWQRLRRRHMEGAGVRHEIVEAVTALSKNGDKKPLRAIFDATTKYSIIRASSVIKILKLTPMLMPEGSELLPILSKWGLVDPRSFVKIVIERTREGIDEICAVTIRVLDDLASDRNGTNGCYGADMILHPDCFVGRQSGQNVALNTGAPADPDPLFGVPSPSLLYPQQQLPTGRSSSRRSSMTHDVSGESLICTPATSSQQSNFQGQHSNFQGQYSNHQGQQSNFQGQQSNFQGQQSNFQGQHSNHQGQYQGLPQTQHQFQQGQNPQSWTGRSQYGHQQQQTGFIYHEGGYATSPTTSPGSGAQALHSQVSAQSFYNQVQANASQQAPWITFSNPDLHTQNSVQPDVGEMRYFLDDFTHPTPTHKGD